MCFCTDCFGFYTGILGGVGVKIGALFLQDVLGSHIVVTSMLSMVVTGSANFLSTAFFQTKGEASDAFTFEYAGTGLWLGASLCVHTGFRTGSTATAATTTLNPVSPKPKPPQLRKPLKA